MKIKKVKLHNFRSYRDVEVSFDNLTALVGKNDIGKSTILEALDIFFNDSKGTVKLDKNDINIDALADGDNTISITVEFGDLPQNIILDDTANTTFAREYMLNKQGNLEIVKKYINAGKAKVFIHAQHPVLEEAQSLLTCKNSTLKDILRRHEITCENMSSNPIMRQAIWSALVNTERLVDMEIELSAGEDKKTYESLQKFLPAYTLFQSDRANSDSDNEVQDPLKTALKELSANESVRSQFKKITETVRARLEEVADKTLTKLRELDPELAQKIDPIIPSAEELKLTDLFKNVSIAGESGIPINKRGSGVRRMILLSFFRARTEEAIAQRNVDGIIYAIEEPETSQHSDTQKQLIDSLKTLATAGAQIILTTHSGHVVKELDISNIRVIYKKDRLRNVTTVDQNILPTITLNEVNYLAFGEISEEYHIDIYSHIAANNWEQELEDSCPKVSYIRSKNNQPKQEMHSLPYKMRNMIHHPENHYNGKYTKQDLQESIEIMRKFIIQKVTRPTT